MRTPGLGVAERYAALGATKNILPGCRVAQDREPVRETATIDGLKESEESAIVRPVGKGYLSACRNQIIPPHKKNGVFGREVDRDARRCGGDVPAVDVCDLRGARDVIRCHEAGNPDRPFVIVHGIKGRRAWPRAGKARSQRREQKHHRSHVQCPPLQRGTPYGRSPVTNKRVQSQPQCSWVVSACSHPSRKMTSPHRRDTEGGRFQNQRSLSEKLSQVTI